MKLKTILWFSMSVVSAQNRSTGNPVVQGDVHVIVDPISIPDSLDQFVREAQAIVIGVVESQGEPWRRRPDSATSIETDFVISVERTLKGPASSRIVVSEMGGALGAVRVLSTYNHFLVKGERYVLFLTPDTRAIAPARGLPRFGVVGIAAGKFQVINGRIKPSQFASPTVLKQYQGESADSFVRQTEASIRAASAGEPPGSTKTTP